LLFLTLLTQHGLQFLNAQIKCSYQHKTNAHKCFNDKGKCKIKMSQLNVTGVMKLLATHLKLWIGNKNWFRKKKYSVYTPIFK
jgi:hypothetical protein